MRYRRNETHRECVHVRINIPKNVSESILRFFTNPFIRIDFQARN
jgi:hypothetical protein